MDTLHAWGSWLGLSLAALLLSAKRAAFGSQRPERIFHLAPVFSREGLPLGGGADVEDVRFMLNFIKAVHNRIRRWLASNEASEALGVEKVVAMQAAFERVLAAAAAVTHPTVVRCDTLRHIRSDVLSIVGAFNFHVRLRASNEEKKHWPRQNLVRMQTGFASGIVPIATPAEYVDPAAVASYMYRDDGTVSGIIASPDDFLGHGYFYYPRPPSFVSTGCKVVNTGKGGDPNMNFDLLEDGFVRLRRASVLTADYPLLRRDFAALANKSEDEIDQWLLDNAAFISDGQLRRISPGGDHHDLLGLQSTASSTSGAVKTTENPFQRLDDVVDTTRRKTAVRARAGGRAATFFAEDKYGFDEESGCIEADLIDVKGCGTHRDVAYNAPSHSGLLGLTDALRGLAVQRLLQRICELEGESKHWSTVQFYAILDTGLKYREGVVDPATGVPGDMCVLALRQAQSRLSFADGVDGFGDFAAGGGNLLLAGDASGLLTRGNGRRARAAMMRYGLSAAIAPGALIDRAEGRVPDSAATLDSCETQWNLQADATVSHFLDFSNFFVFPGYGRLHPAWEMTQATITAACVLGHNSTRYRLDTILGLQLCNDKGPLPFQEDYFRVKRLGPGLPSLMRYLFDTEDQEAAYRCFGTAWRTLSADPTMRRSCNGISRDGTLRSPRCSVESGEGLIIRQLRTKGCQNWFMELDVIQGPIWRWAADKKQIFASPILEQIEAWLPTRDDATTD